MSELKDITNHDSVNDQITQYSNLISLTADNLQDLKLRVKELDNGNYSKELNAINDAQQALYQALQKLELNWEPVFRPGSFIVTFGYTL